jgi:hypothetical protein
MFVREHQNRARDLGRTHHCRDILLRENSLNGNYLGALGFNQLLNLQADSANSDGELFRRLASIGIYRNKCNFSRASEFD